MQTNCTFLVLFGGRVVERVCVVSWRRYFTSINRFQVTRSETKSVVAPGLSSRYINEISWSFKSWEKAIRLPKLGKVHILAALRLAKYPWRDQTSLICRKSVLNRVRLGIYITQIRPSGCVKGISTSRLLIEKLQTWVRWNVEKLSQYVWVDRWKHIIIKEDCCISITWLGCRVIILQGNNQKKYYWVIALISVWFVIFHETLSAVYRGRINIAEQGYFISWPTKFWAGLFESRFTLTQG